MSKFSEDVAKTFAMQLVGPHDHASLHSRSIKPEAFISPVLMIIVCYSSPSLLVIKIYKVKNSKIWCGRSLRLWLCSRMALTAMTSHFQFQTNPNHAYTPYYRVLQLIIFSYDRYFRDLKCQNLALTLTFVKTLRMQSVGPHGHVGPFSRSNQP